MTETAWRLRLLSDERLARRAAEGDRRAFEEVYRRYHQDIYRFCLASTGEPQDAQEALQNTMVKVLRALPGEQRQIQLKPWLYRIARNEAVETIRRRRESAELQPDQAPAPLEIAATAETRERLRGLLADLEELPERQRAALVMREMAGLGFEQIGESLQTSAQAARQTVYEARLGLRQMEAGREMDCEAVMRELSDGDGRAARRRELRAHMRTCESCRAFGEDIAERRGGFAAIAPLPLAVSAGLLQGALGATGAGAAVAASAVAKTAATAAVVAAVGVAAADRGGLIDTPVPGGSAAPAKQVARPAEQPPQSRESGAVGVSGGPAKGEGAPSAPKARRAGGGKSANGSPNRAPGAAATDGPSPSATPGVVPGRGNGGNPPGHGRHRGRPEGLPGAAKHGQDTAAAHKAPQAQTPPGPGQGGGRGGTPGEGAPKPAAAPPAKEPPPPEKPASAQGDPEIAPPTGGPVTPPESGKKPEP